MRRRVSIVGVLGACFESREFSKCKRHCRLEVLVSRDYRDVILRLKSKLGLPGGVKAIYFCGEAIEAALSNSCHMTATNLLEPLCIVFRVEEGAKETEIYGLQAIAPIGSYQPDNAKAGICHGMIC